MASLGIGYRFRVKTVATTPARGTAEVLAPRVPIAHVSKTSLKPLFVSIDTMRVLCLAIEAVTRVYCPHDVVIRGSGAHFWISAQAIEAVVLPQSPARYVP